MKNYTPYPEHSVPVNSLGGGGDMKIAARSYSAFTNLPAIFKATTMVEARSKLRMQSDLPCFVKLLGQANSFLTANGNYHLNDSLDEVTGRSDSSAFSLYLSALVVFDFGMRVYATYKRLESLKAPIPEWEDIIRTLCRSDTVLAGKLATSPNFETEHYKLLTAHAFMDKDRYSTLLNSFADIGNFQNMDVVAPIRDIPHMNLVDWEELFLDCVRKELDASVSSLFLEVHDVISEGFKFVDIEDSLVSSYQGRGMDTDYLEKQRLFNEMPKQEVLLVSHVLDAFLYSTQAAVPWRLIDHLSDPLKDHGVGDYLALIRILTSSKTLEKVFPTFRSCFIYNFQRIERQAKELDSVL